MKYISIPEEQYNRDRELLVAAKETLKWDDDNWVLLSRNVEWDGWGGEHTFYRVISRDVVVDDLNKQIDEMRKDWNKLDDKLYAANNKIDSMKLNQTIAVGVFIFIIFVSLCAALCYIYH